MFHIIILYIILDIRIGFFGYIFGSFGFFGFLDYPSGSVNNTSGSNMFCNTLQDPFEYFFTFRTGYGLGFSVWVLFGFRISGYGYYAQAYVKCRPNEQNQQLAI